MLKKIYQELVAIRKELQAIRSSLEPQKDTTIDVQKFIKAFRETNFRVF